MKKNICLLFIITILYTSLKPSLNYKQLKKLIAQLLSFSTHAIKNQTTHKELENGIDICLDIIEIIQKHPNRNYSASIFLNSFLEKSSNYNNLKEYYATYREDEKSAITYNMQAREEILQIIYEYIKKQDDFNTNKVINKINKIPLPQNINSIQQLLKILNFNDGKLLKDISRKELYKKVELINFEDDSNNILFNAYKSLCCFKIFHEVFEKEMDTNIDENYLFNQMFLNEDKDPRIIEAFKYSPNIDYDDFENKKNKVDGF